MEKEWQPYTTCNLSLIRGEYRSLHNQSRSCTRTSPSLSRRHRKRRPTAMHIRFPNIHIRQSRRCQDRCCRVNRSRSNLFPNCTGRIRCLVRRRRNSRLIGMRRQCRYCCTAQPLGLLPREAQTRPSASHGDAASLVTTTGSELLLAIVCVCPQEREPLNASVVVLAPRGHTRRPV